MYSQFTLLFILVNCLLHARSQSPSGQLPYGCVDCQKNGGTYCYSSASAQFCAATAAYCTSLATTNVIITDCTTTPKICADYNHDCSGCVGSSLGCEMCLTNEDFCISKTATNLLPCYGQTMTSCPNSQPSNIATAYNCIKYQNCTTCSSNNCYWSPMNGPYNTIGCTSTSGTRTFACDDPVTECSALGGTFETRCDCTSNPNCGVCYGMTDTLTNYFCSSEATSSCQSSIINECNDPRIVCPILIDPYDPYGTVCQCTQNPQCTVCLTNPTNEFTPPQLACVGAFYVPPRTCEYTTNNCNDKKITCPKLLSCSTCTAAGCNWCDTQDLASTPTCRAPTDECPNNTVVATTCPSTPCSTYSSCSTCNANSCQWCWSGQTGKSGCLTTCPPTNNQTYVSECSKQDPCSTYTSCSTCNSIKNCSYCTGIPTFAGRNPGFYCSSFPNCGKSSDCGHYKTCVSEPIGNCSIAEYCSAFTDCITCSSSRANIATPCSWCSNNGNTYCGFGCTPGFAVPSCAVYGPTTTAGWPVYTPVPTPTPNGGSGSPGSPVSPSMTTPGGSTTPAGGNTPGGSGNTPGGSGNTPGGSGNTPGGSGNTPGGSGNTPGGSGNTPGGSGNTPGGSGNTPGGSGNTPGGSGNTPGGSGNTPGGSGNTPGGSGNTPGGSGNTPGGSGNTPGGSGNTPGGSGNTPGGSGNTPGGNGSSTTGSNTNRGITGNGTGVVNGFDFVLFGIIVGVILVVIIIIVIVVVILKGRGGSESV